MAVTYENRTKRITKLFCEIKDDFGRKTYREMGFHLVYFMDGTEMKGPVLGPYVEPNNFMPFNDVCQFPGEGEPISQIAIEKLEVVKNAKGGGNWGFWKGPFV